MKKITLSFAEEKSFITAADIAGYQEKVTELHTAIHDKTGAGADYLGWVELPEGITDDQLGELESVAGEIRENGDFFISIGIGGSYLGAKAVIEALTGAFSNLTGKPKMLFAGQNISGAYLTGLLSLIKGGKSYVNVISKSGTTTEPAIAFRCIKELMQSQGDPLKDRIIATTDREKGALREVANREGYRSFVIPGDVGGRFSVLTPVGLLPIAVAGIDIRELVRGARDMASLIAADNLEKNDAYTYAVIRNILYNRGKATELLVSYEPQLLYIAEWWKQLFGESEGKEHKSLFTASCNFTTDLHSLGQWIQDGVRNIFETVIAVDEEQCGLTVPSDPDDLDKLNYIAGKTLKYINDKAMEGTMEAHVSGGVPNIQLSLPAITPYYIGQLLYFFEKACAMSGYLLGINPFDQPGVEAYKKNMFRLLGKPGV